MGSGTDRWKQAAQRAAKKAKQAAAAAAREADRLYQAARRQVGSAEGRRRLKQALQKTGRVLRAAGKAAVAAGMAAIANERSGPPPRPAKPRTRARRRGGSKRRKR